MALEKLDIPPVRVRCYRDHEVVNVREDQALGNGRVEGRDIDDEQQRRDGGALWSYCSWSLPKAIYQVFRKRN